MTKQEQIQIEESEREEFLRDCWNSQDYPLGGMLELYDIERDKELV